MNETPLTRRRKLRLALGSGLIIVLTFLNSLNNRELAWESVILYSLSFALVMMYTYFSIPRKKNVDVDSMMISWIVAVFVIMAITYIIEFLQWPSLSTNQLIATLVSGTFLSIITILILYVPSRASTSRHFTVNVCPECGFSTKSTSRRCPHCGTRMTFHE